MFVHWDEYIPSTISQARSQIRQLLTQIFGLKFSACYFLKMCHGLSLRAAEMNAGQSRTDKNTYTHNLLNAMDTHNRNNNFSQNFQTVA